MAITIIIILLFNENVQTCNYHSNRHHSLLQFPLGVAKTAISKLYTATHTVYKPKHVP